MGEIAFFRMIFPVGNALLVTKFAFILQKFLKASRLCRAERLLCRAERPGHPHGTIHRPIETLVTPMGQPYVVHPDRARRDCLFHEAKGFMTEGMMTRAKLFGDFCGYAAGPPNTFATGDLEGASSHGQ